MHKRQAKIFAAVITAWALKEHPEWGKIAIRTKKKRTRKKYTDRIWIEGIKALEEAARAEG